MKRSAGIVGLLILGTALLAACGEESPAATATPPPASSDDRAVPPLASGVFDRDDCMQAAIAVSSAIGLAFGMGTVSPDELKRLDEEFERARDAAPDQIARDLQVMADAFREIGLEIERSGWNPQASQVPPASVMRAFEAFNSDAFSQASERVTGWFDGSCAN